MNSKKYIKMKKIFAMTVFTLFIFTQAAFSQVPGYWSFQYAMGFGSGDLAEYISQPSFRGGVIEYRKAIKDNVLVGVDFGWNVFYEKKDADTYTSGTEALSGVQYRTQNAIPILVSAEYFSFHPKCTETLCRIRYRHHVPGKIHRHGTMENKRKSLELCSET
jgi:hypothetical protein